MSDGRSEDPDLVERRIEQRRADMAALLNELRGRATVGYVARTAKHGALPALAMAGPAAGRTALRHPVATALVSAGLSWFLFAPEPDLNDLTRKAKAGTEGLIDKAVGTVEQAKSKVAEGGRLAADNLRGVGGSLERSARRALQVVPHPSDTGVIAAASFAGAVALGLIAMKRSA